MNDQNPSTPELPELSQASVDRIEKAVFAQLSAERTASVAPAPSSSKRKRRRGWITGIGIATAFVAGILIAPPLFSGVTSVTASSEAGESADVSAPGSFDQSAPEVASDAAAEVADGTEREIISTATATLRVDDIPGAVDAIAALAEEHDGYVESTNISTADITITADPSAEDGWVSIRVPSDALTTVIAALGDTGTVLASSTSKQDVTSTAIDLRARIQATQASVTRLTELMSQSGSVADLIDAEVALTERQGELESYTQQLEALEDQVAMSVLEVDLTQQGRVTSAEPAGFGDGLLAGWNGLIVSLNALVVALGFLLPWLVIAGAVAVVVWLIIRRRRRREASDVP